MIKTGFKNAVVLLAAGASSLVLANEDSGTSAVAEMNISGAQFGMLVGGVVVVGVVLWLVVRLMNRR